MNDVSILGLGNMGAALAWCLHRSGHAITVWNRSEARAQPFADVGIDVAGDAATAIAASPVSVICVDSTPTADSFLQIDPVADALTGKTIIQFSTGTPREVDASAQWITDQGDIYLHGAVHCGPGHIGTDDAAFLISPVTGGASSTTHGRRSKPLAARCRSSARARRPPWRSISPRSARSTPALPRPHTPR